jgi:hypothetical protein
MCSRRDSFRSGVDSSLQLCSAEIAFYYVREKNIFKTERYGATALQNADNPGAIRELGNGFREPSLRYMRYIPI